MGLLTLKCSQCGAKIEVDENKDRMFCPNCGTEFKIANENKTYNNNFLINNATIIQQNVGKEKNYQAIQLKSLIGGIGNSAYPIQVIVDGKAVGQVYKKETTVIHIDVNEEHHIQCVMNSVEREFTSNVLFIPKGGLDKDLVVKTCNQGLFTKIELQKTDNLLGEKAKMTKISLFSLILLGLMSIVLIVLLIILCLM